MSSTQSKSGGGGSKHSSSIISANFADSQSLSLENGTGSKGTFAKDCNNEISAKDDEVNQTKSSDQGKNIEQQKEELDNIMSKEEQLRKASLVNLRYAYEVPNDHSSDSESEESQKLRQRRHKRSFTDEEIRSIPRFVHRNRFFYQSENTVATISKYARRAYCSRLRTGGWYHMLLNLNTLFSVTILLGLWIFWMLIFAVMYTSLDSFEEDCGLSPVGQRTSLRYAFLFSIQASVGYAFPGGEDDFYQEECTGLQVFVFFQILFNILFSAFLVSFFFAKLGTSEQRASQILFSKEAIITCRRGKWTFQMQVYDTNSKQPVVEAHVRMYCVSWRDYEKQTRTGNGCLYHEMKISAPSDSTDASLLLSLPTPVEHEIGEDSPLLPRKIKMNLRSNGTCPVCGQKHDSLDALKKHLEYYKITEDLLGFPIRGTHRDSDLTQPRNLHDVRKVTENNLREHLVDKEIVCVVEGVEPIGSGSFQALQSYKFSDIIFGGRFAPSMSQQNGIIHIDTVRFPKVLPPSASSFIRTS